MTSAKLSEIGTPLAPLVRIWYRYTPKNSCNPPYFTFCLGIPPPSQCRRHISIAPKEREKLLALSKKPPGRPAASNPAVGIAVVAAMTYQGQGGRVEEEDEDEVEEEDGSGAASSSADKQGRNSKHKKYHDNHYRIPIGKGDTTDFFRLIKFI